MSAGDIINCWHRTGPPRSCWVLSMIRGYLWAYCTITRCFLNSLSLNAVQKYQNKVNTNKLFWKPSKLLCESTTNPVPVLRIAASRGFSELTKNVIRSSHGHSTPFLKISCKSVQPFSRNLANKETKIHTNKEIDRKQYPAPRCIGDGVKSRKRNKEFK